MFPTSESTFISTKPAIKWSDAGDLDFCHMVFMTGTVQSVTVHLVLVKLSGFMFVSSAGHRTLSGQAAGKLGSSRGSSDCSKDGWISCV